MPFWLSNRKADRHLVEIGRVGNGNSSCLEVGGRMETQFVGTDPQRRAGQQGSVGSAIVVCDNFRQEADRAFTDLEKRYFHAHGWLTENIIEDMGG